MQNDISSFETTCETKLDLQVNKQDAERKSKIKAYAGKQGHANAVHLEVGDEVLVKNLHKRSKLSTHYESKPYKVIKVYPSSCKIQSASGENFHRNKAHLKKYVSNVSSKEKGRNGNVVRIDNPQPHSIHLDTRRLIKLQRHQNLSKRFPSQSSTKARAIWYKAGLNFYSNKDLFVLPTAMI